MKAADRSRSAATVGPNYPIAIGNLFLVATVLIYWLRFPEDREPFVMVYALTCVLALGLGIRLGRRNSPPAERASSPSRQWFWFYCGILVLTCTVNISTFYSSPSEVAEFLSEPGAAYERVKQLSRSGDVNEGILGGRIGPIITMLSFTKFIVFGWAAWYWKTMSRTARVISSGVMAYYALQAVLIGAMVNVGTVLISTLTILIVRGRSTLKTQGGRFVSASFAPAVLGLVTLSYFLGSRDSSAMTAVARIKAGADGLLFYVSHGYVGLGHALDQPFVFTGGQTMFYGLTRVFGNGLSPQSYPARTQEATGWSADQLWSTAAPWLASDITFWGVPPLLLLIGVWSSRVWASACTDHNPFALLMLGQIAVGIFFFPANNHLFQSFSSASGFLVILMMYWRNLRRNRGLTNGSELGPLVPVRANTKEPFAK